MALTEKKRIRRDNHQDVFKRRKTGKESLKTRAASSVDSLPWSQVPLPDRLDDAEGFFGLDEISGVDIVRNTTSGKVEYRVRDDHKKSGANQEIEDQETIDQPSTQSEDAEEWEGFGDPATLDDLDEGQWKDAARFVDNTEHIEKKRKRKPKDARLNSSEKGTSLLPSNPFEGLEDDDEEGCDGRLNFSSPTPIQQSAIPEIMKGHDVIGKASTGSGKTLAFGIPIYEHFLRTRSGLGNGSSSNGAEGDHSLMAVIISPTRELAHQLSQHFADLCSNPSSPSMSIATLTGGLSVQKQKRLLSHADIIIGTPGRLWEVIGESKGLGDRLKKVKYLVLDEADRLLSEGHFKEVEEILNALDREDETHEDRTETLSLTPSSKSQRQTLVFSATFQKNLQQKLSGKSKFSTNELLGTQASMEYLLKKLNFQEPKPKFIDVNPVSQMATKLKECILECASLEKDLYLYSLLALQPPTQRILVFTNSIPSTRRLSTLLSSLSLPLQTLHSQMPQKARLRALERFSAPSSPTKTPQKQTPQILVCTDVAARGLDIPAVNLIIHYHLPRTADTYVHRSGRTARAEKEGKSILLCAPGEVQGVRRLVAKVHVGAEASVGGKGKNTFMQSVMLDRGIVSRLKRRVVLAQKVAEAELAKERMRHEERWVKDAAEDLGVEFDDDDEEEEALSELLAGGGGKGRGQGRRRKEKEAGGMGKAEMGALKAELRAELGRRVNTGVSEKYLTSGGVDVDSLLEDGGGGGFLGRVEMDGLV